MKQSTLHFPIPYLIRRDLAGQSADSEEYADLQLEPHEKYLDDWAQTSNSLGVRFWSVSLEFVEGEQ